MGMMSGNNNGFNSGLGGFMQGFSNTYFPGMRRNEQERLQREQMAEQKRARGMMEQMQQERLDLTRQQVADQQSQYANLRRQQQADAMLARNPNLASLSPETLQNEAWATNLQHASPAQITAAKAYVSPEQKLKNQIFMKQLDAQYKAMGREPKWDLFEDPATGEQRYVVKGQAVPGGLKRVSNATTQISFGEKPVPTEKARMLALSGAGKKKAQKARTLLFNEDGTVDRGVINALKAPFDIASTGILGSKASAAYSAVREAITSKLRLESGAVISQAEIDEAMRQYLPGTMDTPEVAQGKLQGLIEVLEEYEELGRRGVASVPIDGNPTPDPPQPSIKPDLVYNPETGEFE